MALFPRIIIRADGHAQIGMGHVMRCIALADMLYGLASCEFAIAQPSANVLVTLAAAKVPVISLVTKSVDEFLGILSLNDIVVLDGYSFDEAFQRAVRQHINKLIVIDDLVTGWQVADVIINHAGGIMASEYKAEAYTQFLIGPQYALLNKAFLQPKGYSSLLMTGSIFINLGGSDSTNLSWWVLQALSQIDIHLPVSIVLGMFHPDRDSILNFRQTMPNLTILQNVSPAQMATELQQCQLAITACSTISYEVCSINRPLIALVTASNQQRLAEFYQTENIVISVISPWEPSSNPMVRFTDEVKSAVQTGLSVGPTVDITIKNQQRHLDHRSPERLRAFFQSFINQ